jgi:aldehyde:ferredoxin oxidoreductase
MFGYFGKILTVDLTTGRSTTRPLLPELAADYLGGRGLATRLFYDEVDASCDPLGCDNVLVIAASPLIGTNAPTAGRGHMVFKSPLTGAIGSSNCGGTWGAAFKAAGYDALVIRGRAASPVVLDINPAGAELLPADNLWGLDTHATTDRLQESADPSVRFRALCIGPAGENLVRYAAVFNDKNRPYGRCGPGAVFGSKNLKAVRAAGREKIYIHDRERYQSGYDQAMYLIKQVPATKRILRDLGTAGLAELIDLINMLPHRNFRDTSHRQEDVERISGETIARTILERAGGCYLCPIACQRHTRIGEKRGEGPEYETVILMGPVCDIYDLSAISRANYLCNELGMDTISYGGTVACAMELAELGKIPAMQDGLDIRFGNSRALEELVSMTAHRRGIGDLLAEGSYRLAVSTGHPESSMAVKKMEFPAYDPRASFTQALGYMTSPTGACHLRGGYAVSLAFFGGNKEIPRFSLLQSPISIRNLQNTGILQDSLGICRFTGFAFGPDPWARMVSGATGMDFSVGRFEEIENRIAALERLFNLEAGLTSADDALPARFSDEPILVSGEKKAITREAQERMKRDYYEARGWDREGKPTPGLLGALRIKAR